MRDENGSEFSRTGKPEQTGAAGGDAGAPDQPAQAGTTESAEERFDRLVHEMEVANDCRPPRPGDPDY